MDYQLTIGTRQFEQLAQALAYAELGSSVSVFGDGPDGGREATWERRTIEGADSFADGFGVLQAKMRQFPEDPADNLRWLVKELESELSKWASPSSNRVRQPEKLLLATNVRLSPGTGGGKESILRSARDIAQRHGINVTVRVWDYADLCTRIDANDSVRKTFLAWILPGDVLSQLLDEHVPRQERIASVLRAHASRTFLSDANLNLRQAGSVADQPLSLFDVFTDLPVKPYRAGSPVAGDASGPLAAATVVRLADDLVGPSRRGPDGPSNRRIVLVGGPGQGKSTITQFIAQLYRAEFLSGSSLAQGESLRGIIAQLIEATVRTRTPRPSGRRWPIRVILSDLADALASREANSVLSYVAMAVSKRSAVPVDAQDLLYWLGAYPWMLIIDGLDEVPNTSNREQVLEALSDFYVEAENVGADVVSVATTRPQGYNDEFRPSDFRHLELTKLSVKEGMDYAEVLVRARAGADQESADRTLASLSKSSRDPSIQRLFSAPLQIAILTVLVEQIGQIPNDRWRLFSQYYVVMTNRERAKGGELSELLQRHESDVHYIHHKIGFELQLRSADAGEASSTMTRDEFESLMAHRLREQEHPADEIDRLVADFRRLTTERLVFLAALDAGNIGFEIRSLQEFMAGEYIVSLGEQETVSKLFEVARLPYWRNVVLFASGKIFIERERLKAEVVNLCAELDLADDASTILKPGAELALDLLLDGSPNSQPRYARPLADRAASLIDGLPNERVADLALVSEGEAGKVLRRAIFDVTTAPAATWRNRTVALVAMPRTEESIVDALSERLALVQGESRRAIIDAAWDANSPRSRRFLSSKLESIDPLELPHPVVDGYDDSATDPEDDDLCYDLMRILDSSSETNSMVAVTESEALSVYTFMRSDHDAWSHLAETVASDVGGWPFVRAIGRFIEDPSPEALAHVIERASADDVARVQKLRAVPWQISACMNELGIPGRAGSFRQRAAALAEQARNGELGTSEDWRRIESRLVGFVGDWIEEGLTDRARLPIEPSMTTSGLPWAALWVGVTMPTTAEERATTLKLALEAGRAVESNRGSTSFRRFAATNAMFLLSHAWDYVEEEHSLPDALEEEIVRLMTACLDLPEHGAHLVWCDWASFLSERSWEVLLEGGQLARIARSWRLSPSWHRRLHRGPSHSPFAEWLLSAPVASVDPLLYRYSFILSPRAFKARGGLSKLPDRTTVDVSDRDQWHRFEAAARLLQASAQEIGSGGMDADILTVCRGTSIETIDPGFVRALIDERVVEAPDELAIRAAQVLIDRDVREAAEFAAMARGADEGVEE